MKILKKFLLILFFTACASTEDFDVNTPDGAFKSANQLEENERYEEAITAYRELKNKFPYSHFATEADLHIADVYFNKEAYLESQSSYQLFIDLHPKHEKVPYALYKLADSIYNQLPSTVDRDLSLGPKAQNYFKLLIDKFPGSIHASEAKEKINSIEKKLQEKELYIADYYFKTDAYMSAMKRYQDFLDRWPKSDKSPYAALRTILSAKQINEGDTIKSYYRKLTTEFPGTDEAKAAQGEFSNHVDR